MNLHDARVALRPRTMSDVIDLAGPFAMANRRLMVPLALLVTSVGGGLCLLCRTQLGWSWTRVWLFVAGYLVLADGLFALAAGELLFRRPEEIRILALLGRFVRRLPAFVAAKLAHVLILGVCAALFVPLPIFGARLFFVSEAVLLEAGRPLGSLGRSSRLVLFRSLPCLGLALACLCAPFGLAVAAEVVGDTVVSLVLQMGRPFGSLWSDGGSVYAVVGALLSAPFVASASFLGYIDMRTRKEGWDIQLRFTALAEAEARQRRIAS